MDAYDLIERHTAQRKGIALAKIVRRGQRQALQIFQTVNVLGPKAHRFEFPAIFRRPLVSVSDGPPQPFGLEFPQLL